jgi:hypothetical protein
MGKSVLTLIANALDGTIARKGIKVVPKGERESG